MTHVVDVQFLSTAFLDDVTVDVASYGRLAAGRTCSGKCWADYNVSFLRSTPSIKTALNVIMNNMSCLIMQMQMHTVQRLDLT